MINDEKVDPIILPARLLAAGWLHVWGATGQDKEDWEKYRTVVVEVYPDDGIRLWATDRYVMFRTFVPLAELVDDDGPIQEPPPLDEEPAATLVVRDSEQRAHALFAYLAKSDPKDKEQGGAARTVLLSTGRMDDEYQPRLGDVVDLWGLLIASPDERLLVPLAEGFDVPDWRKLAAEAEPGAASSVALNGSNFRALARLASGSLDGVSMSFPKEPGRAIVIRAECMPPVDGLVMPVRPPAPPAPPAVEAEEPTPPARAKREKRTEDGGAAASAARVVDVDPDADDPFAGLDDLEARDFFDDIRGGG